MILALIKLTRPYYSLPLSCGLIAITAYITGGDFSILGAKLVRACVSLYLVISAGYTLNDIIDKPVDAINNPNRVLTRGLIHPQTATASAGILFVSGIGLSISAGVWFGVILTLVACGLVLYDLFSKKMRFSKNIMAAVLTVSLYPLSFALAEPVSTPRLNALYIFPVWLFLTTTGYEMLKDIRDVKGDSVRNTDRAYCESPAFLSAARIITLAAVVLSLLPYVLGYCREIYLGSSIVTIALAGLSLKLPPEKAIRPLYAGVFIISAGSLADLLVYGP